MKNINKQRKASLLVLTFAMALAIYLNRQYARGTADNYISVDDTIQKANAVQIMTLHKSKGDEFDWVFIPELTQKNLCFNINEYELKENSKFIQKVKKEPKNDLELKKDIIEENFRLIYVGITRAKKKLYLTTSNKYKYFAKVIPYKNSEILEGLAQYV